MLQIYEYIIAYKVHIANVNVTAKVFFSVYCTKNSPANNVIKHIFTTALDVDMSNVSIELNAVSSFSEVINVKKFSEAMRNELLIYGKKLSGLKLTIV